MGNAIFAKNPAARIVYLSSEEFTNEFVESVRDHKMTDFRRKFRDECDVLLIDDIQFLGKREETQKEFFYTFNALHEMSKAIVLTSDAVPAEIPGLEDRLRSRFTMGLITDIQEPNYETRVAILKKKAEADGFDLPDNVCHFIAKHVQKNVRELEGALIKISAVHSLTGQPVTEEFAAQVLRGHPAGAAADRRRPHPAGDGPVLQGGGGGAPRRPAAPSSSRTRGRWRCTSRRKLTQSSFPEIAARFNKDHSTVISSVRKVERQREVDASVRKELDELESKLGPG